MECFDNLRSDRICGFLSKKRTNLQFEFRISDLSARIETRGNVEQIRSEENLKSSSDVNNPFHSKLKLWLVLIS